MKQAEDEAQDYKRVAAAIGYISAHHLSQPSLETVAKEVGLSPFHFQKIFTRWAGVSPKKFLQSATLNFTKQALRTPNATLFDVASESGLSGTGRLHDLFVRFEAMTPGEYKNGGEHLHINFHFVDTIFGEAIIARTERGICHLMFENDRTAGLETLRSNFPNAVLELQDHSTFHDAVSIFRSRMHFQPLSLHLKGSPFQLKVWEALLNIPPGMVTTYGQLAAGLDMKNSSRAVGTAIGKNPVAVLIPCHRVIQASGAAGGYRWGTDRKRIILARESTNISAQENAFER